MVIPPIITRSRVEKEPQAIWNTFVDFISRADTREMNDVQMAAQLPFWYDREVCQGGHLRYFEDGYTRLEDRLNVLVIATLDALRILRAESHAVILKAASDTYFSKPRRHAIDADELQHMMRKGEFASYDEAYHRASPAMREILEGYLMSHLADFVQIV